MLYPQDNAYRQKKDLSGIWDFKFDPENTGIQENWHLGLTHSRPIAVPASWNEQFESGRDFLGPAWYQTMFQVPWEWDGKEVFLRFGSVNYLADAWVNGEHLGQHEGGNLPFQFEATHHLKTGNNLLVLRVDGNLAFDRVPPGNVRGEAIDFFPSHFGNTPMAHFDFFPYCGIHRPVLLYAVPKERIQDITVHTEIEGTTGLVGIQVKLDTEKPVVLQIHLSDNEGKITETLEVKTNSVDTRLTVPNAALWSPEAPNLYQLTASIVRDGQTLDTYTLEIGIRTIRVVGNQLLLNGKPVYLRGFGRHEDFPITGRGYIPAVAIKDYAIMKWVGANSFRTTHYPYSEQMMDLADRLGFLVIDEIPAVGLYFREDGLEKRLDLCQQYVTELIARDKNHPSVILWSIANEPHSERPEAKFFFNELYQLSKSLDPTRPVTLVSHLGEAEESFEFLDLMCLNRYRGWYSEPGDLNTGLVKLSEELDKLYEKYQKPLIITEFGADTIPGHHAQPPEMFSEEYQVAFLRGYLELFREKSYIVGEHVWNLCDFKTSQGITRMGSMNYKGVFTRDRRPKMAAHMLRSEWTEETD